MISIFPTSPGNPPVEIQNIEKDIQGVVSYHFDAIVRFNTEFKNTFTSYPIEFGADMQDHGYSLPDSIVIEGYMGSNELSFSVNPLPSIGASAVIGKINNPVLSAAVGVAADYLGGNEEHRGKTTLEFLKELKESMMRFDIQTDLIVIKGLKIDSISTETIPENETGLEFTVAMSQLRMTAEEGTDDQSTEDLPDDDPAKTMGAKVSERGKVALKEVENTAISTAAGGGGNPLGF